jgi:hypothetical protein
VRSAENRSLPACGRCFTRRYAEPAASASEVRESFLEAMAEFAAERRGAPVDQTMIGHEIRTFGETWHTTEGFAAFVRSLRAEALEETPRPKGWVPCTTWWWLENDGLPRPDRAAAQADRAPAPRRWTHRLRRPTGCPPPRLCDRDAACRASRGCRPWDLLGAGGLHWWIEITPSYQLRAALHESRFRRPETP